MILFAWASPQRVVLGKRLLYTCVSAYWQRPSLFLFTHHHVTVGYRLHSCSRKSERRTDLFLDPRLDRISYFMGLLLRRAFWKFRVNSEKRCFGSCKDSASCQRSWSCGPPPPLSLHILSRSTEKTSMLSFPTSGKFSKTTPAAFRVRKKRSKLLYSQVISGNHFSFVFLIVSTLAGTQTPALRIC